MTIAASTAHATAVVQDCSTTDLRLTLAAYRHGDSSFVLLAAVTAQPVADGTLSQMLQLPACATDVVLIRGLAPATVTSFTMLLAHTTSSGCGTSQSNGGSGSPTQSNDGSSSSGSSGSKDGTPPSTPASGGDGGTTTGDPGSGSGTGDGGTGQPPTSGGDDGTSNGGTDDGGSGTSGGSGDEHHGDDSSERGSVVHHAAESDSAMSNAMQPLGSSHDASPDTAQRR